MRPFCGLMVLLVLLPSCVTVHIPNLPELNNEASTDSMKGSQIKQRCEQVFLKDPYQFVHSITFRLSNGHGATVIGVTVLDGDTLKTGLMGVEGFVLFEAELSGDRKLEVIRALPPFDSPEFASGLMRDVQTIFYAPADKHPRTGKLADGAAVCRYLYDNGQVTDVIVHGNGSYYINVYDASHDARRSIAVGPRVSVNGEMIPKTLGLQAHGRRGYTLTMTLISADKIEK